MKRDFDLVREILLYFEERDEISVLTELEIEEYDKRLVAYNLRLMYEAGFLQAEPVRSSTSNRLIGVHPFELTWAGYEFLDAIRNDTVWSKAKAKFVSTLETVPFTILKELALSTIRGELG